MDTIRIRVFKQKARIVIYRRDPTYVLRVACFNEQGSLTP